MPALARDRIDRPHTGEEDVIADTYAGHVRQVGASRRVEHRVDRLDYRTRQSRGGARLQLGPGRPTNRGQPMVSLRNLLSFGRVSEPQVRHITSGRHRTAVI